MRLLRAGCLALGLAPQAGLAALAQDTPQLFAPAPKSPPAPAPSAKTIPVVRTSLTEVPPVPIARPTPPQIRSTLTETAEPQIPAPIARPPIADYEPRQIAFADGVTGLLDIPYATLPGFRPLTLDIYAPRTPPAPLPLVVFIHGGDWNSGDSRHAAPFADFPRVLASLAAQGYVVASINYRLSQEARFPAALQDVKAAIRWMRVHASAYGGDPTRLAAWGISAGGQLAALAGTTCGVMRFAPDGEVPHDAPSDCTEAVIDWYGATDLQTLAADNGRPVTGGFNFAAGSTSAEGNYLGCEPAACAPGLARLASPLAFIAEGGPAFLIQHGGADTIVSPKQSQKFYDALKAKGVPAEIVIYEGAGHDFALGGAPDGATVAKAMARLTDFLAATFRGKSRPQIRRTVAN